MKLNESNVIDVECNNINVKKIKKTVYRDLEIYAVKRSTAYNNTECALLDGTNTAWWCGYVEVPTAMYSSFKPRGYLDDEILYRLADPYSYNLEVVHGGYTYMDYGIPLVLDDNQRIFIGWDYNHSEDTESCITYDEIINVGKKVIDSMFKNIENNNKYTYDDLIVNPSKEGLESLIGKEVYYGDIPLYCIKGANENYKIGILREVRKNEAAPFRIEILPMGCTLNYACIIPKKEEPKPKYIPFETVTEFLDAHRSAPDCLPGEACYLSKNGIWLKGKVSKSYCMVTRIGDIGVFIIDDSDGITSWEELLEYYTFLDGTPCGKLEE